MRQRKTEQDLNVSSLHLPIQFFNVSMVALCIHFLKPFFISELSILARRTIWLENIMDYFNSTKNKLKSGYESSREKKSSVILKKIQGKKIMINCVIQSASRTISL